MLRLETWTDVLVLLYAKGLKIVALFILAFDCWTPLPVSCLALLSKRTLKKSTIRCWSLSVITNLLICLSDQDLDDVFLIFQDFKDSPPIHSNMAPITGALSWTHELKDRVSKYREKLLSLNHPVLASEEATLVKNKYTELYATLEAYEKSLYTSWAANIIDESEANLLKPILVKGEDGLLNVNFDPKVVALLREVRYMDSLQVNPPDVASTIYSKSDTFRKFIFQLDHIADMYNGIQTGVLDVEKPLIAGKCMLLIPAQIK